MKNCMSTRDCLDCGCALLRSGETVVRRPVHNAPVGPNTANELLQQDLHHQRERERRTAATAAAGRTPPSSRGLRE